MKTFLWTTILGVIPGTIAYTLAGSGLQEIFDEKGSSLSSVFNIRLNIALGLLAIMALLPVFFKKIKNRYFMSITYRDLYKKVDEIKAVVEVGSYYTHYKNLFKKYKILHIGLLEGSDVPCVIYQAVEDPGSKEGLVWVRLLDNFLSSVIVDGKEVSRFIKCNDNI